MRPGVGQCYNSNEIDTMDKSQNLSWINLKFYTIFILFPNNIYINIIGL